MPPASRTPEGWQNECPVCGQAVIIEPSQPSGDAPCPHCGVLLWFLRGNEQAMLWQALGDAHWERFVDFIALQLDIEPGQDRAATEAFLSGLLRDSLETVELIMEFEDWLEEAGRG